MFARVSTIQGKPERVEDGIRNYREQVMPSVQKMAGFKGAYFMVDRKTGKVVSITLWDTEKNPASQCFGCGPPTCAGIPNRVCTQTIGCRDL